MCRSTVGGTLFHSLSTLNAIGAKVNQTTLITYILLLGAEADHIIMDLGHDALACDEALNDVTLEFDASYSLLGPTSRMTLALLDW